MIDIQGIAGISAFLVGLAYVVGGLIVNLNLSGYGVTEYQIVRIKYLVVGLVYLANIIVVLILGSIPALILLIDGRLVVQQVFLLASLFSSAALLVLWGRAIDLRRMTVMRAEILLIAAGVISAAFPMLVLFRQSLTGSTDYYAKFFIVEASITGILALIGSIYYYARYIYGRRDLAFAADPIGMGVCVLIQLAGTETDITLLSHMGIPTLAPDLTDNVTLLDETDEHYILSIPSLEKVRVMKIEKKLVKGIVYHG